jgi:hypothetical protein
MSKAGKTIGGLAVAGAVIGLLGVGLWKGNLELAMVGVISAFIFGSTGVVLGKKCDDKNNQIYAKTVTSIVSVIMAIAVGYMLLFIEKARIPFAITALGSILLASTTIILSNKCTDKSNQDYAKTVMGISGSGAAIVLGYLLFLAHGKMKK